MRRGNDPIILSSLKLLAHLVGIVVAHNTYPKKGGIGKTPDWNLLMIFLLMQGHLINLTDFIFDGMAEVAMGSRHMSYENFVMWIIQPFHCPLEGLIKIVPSLPLMNNKAIKMKPLEDEEGHQRKKRK